ncbi:uncharacterized protein LOC120328119 [Styela clava]|uniref:uncharacterized protein LOC120328119 n=1 Tax=Styela clava TaxID=7725 RepID=UPI00193A72FC|nr:uncharacterized protein LOC120328119 [Styela clava]
MFTRDKNGCMKKVQNSRKEVKTRTLERKVHIENIRDYTIKLCLIIAIILCCQVSTSYANMCNPKNASTCKYMGKCVNIRLLKQYYPRQTPVGEELYICTCPLMSCYTLAMDAICADTGTSKETFYNDMCMRLAQCEMQRPFKKVCRGVCGDKNCRPFEKEPNLKNCPEENEDYCHNRGVCLMFRDGPQDPFCRCQREYTGPRCKERRVSTLFGEEL